MQYIFATSRQAPRFTSSVRIISSLSHSHDEEEAKQTFYWCTFHCHIIFSRFLARTSTRPQFLRFFASHSIAFLNETLINEGSSKVERMFRHVFEVTYCATISLWRLLLGSGLESSKANRCKWPKKLDAGRKLWSEGGGVRQEVYWIGSGWDFRKSYWLRAGIKGTLFSSSLSYLRTLNASAGKTHYLDQNFLHS